MTKCIIDTNLIVRYLISDNDNLYLQVKEIFDLIKIGKIKAYFEQTVLTETVFILDKVYQVPRDKICITLSELLNYKGIYNEEKLMLRKALQIYQETKLHIVDCIIISKVKLQKLDIKSFDKELLSYTEKV